MSSFVSQSQKYDAQEIEIIIEDLEKELQDEVAVRQTLDETADEKMAAAEKFMTENSEKIREQLARMLDLNQKIRGLVDENQRLEDADVMYKDLISSQPYEEIANDIAKIKAISADLTSFLVKTGRRGRPVSK